MWILVRIISRNFQKPCAERFTSFFKGFTWNILPNTSEGNSFFPTNVEETRSYKLENSRNIEVKYLFYFQAWVQTSRSFTSIFNALDTFYASRLSVFNLWQMAHFGKLSYLLWFYIIIFNSPIYFCLSLIRFSINIKIQLGKPDIRRK